MDIVQSKSICKMWVLKIFDVQSIIAFKYFTASNVQIFVRFFFHKYSSKLQDNHSTEITIKRKSIIVFKSIKMIEFVAVLYLFL